MSSFDTLVLCVLKSLKRRQPNAPGQAQTLRPKPNKRPNCELPSSVQRASHFSGASLLSLRTLGSGASAVGIEGSSHPVTRKEFRRPEDAHRAPRVPRIHGGEHFSPPLTFTLRRVSSDVDVRGGNHFQHWSPFASHGISPKLPAVAEDPPSPPAQRCQRAVIIRSVWSLWRFWLPA